MSTEQRAVAAQSPSLAPLTEDRARSVDAALRLLDAQMRQFNATRDIQWKVNLALWPGLAVLSGFALTKICTSPVPEWAAYLGAAVITLAHSVWRLLLQGSLNYDKNRWVEYRAAIVKAIISESSKSGASHNWWARLWESVQPWLWVIVELAITAVLALLTAFILSGA